MAVQVVVGVTEEVAGTGAERRCLIVGVVERAHPEREAPAADAGREVVAQPFENGDLLVQAGPPSWESRAQSALFGVREAGSVANASRISSRVRPTRCATRMKATRRNMSRWKRRCPRGARPR